MQFGEIASDLQAVDLSEDQARLYLRLLELGQAKVSDLTVYFDCSRSKLYRVLDELADLGLVVKSLSRPTTFEAVSPEEFFDMALSSISRDREQIEALREERLEELEALHESAPEGSEDHHWRRLEGANAILGAEQKLVEQAEEDVRCASTLEVQPAGAPSDARRTWRTAASRAAEDGVEVRLLLDADGPLTDRLPEGIHDPDPVEVRGLEREETVHFVVVDGAELLMWVDPTEASPVGDDEPVAVWTDAPASVDTHRLLFEKLWPEGTPLDGS